MGGYAAFDLVASRRYRRDLGIHPCQVTDDVAIADGYWEDIDHALPKQ
jgi:hypothetical protein